MTVGKTEVSMRKTLKQEAIAYYRVSTVDQNFDGQKACVFDYCNKNDLKVKKEIKYKVGSGKARGKRGIDELACFVKNNNNSNTIVISELSRFGRSISEILALVDEFVNEYSCSLIFVKENLRLGVCEDNRDQYSKIVLTLFAMLAELEKGLISQRVKEALNARRKAGVKLGRPRLKSKLDSKEDEIKGLLDMGVKQKAIAKKYKCTEATLSNWLKRKRREWATG